MRTADAISQIAAKLAAAGIEDARREARMILGFSAGVDAAGLLLLAEVPDDLGTAIVERRVRREPLAYILGRKEFWGLEFAVSKATLIPRPDSETIIEAALAAYPRRGEVRRILDLGTGTGCLLLAALSEFKNAFGVGLDISPQAACLAAANAKNLGFADRCAFAVGDWTAALTCSPESLKFDLVLSNPPYIAAAEFAGLMPEVGQYEPATALYGGADGLAAYRAIIHALPAVLADSGMALLELGISQAKPVVDFAMAAGFKADLRQDMANIPRVALIQA
jgi:release factor glutamine methyltransferase